MSRGFSALGVGGALICGVFIAWTTFQPELESQRAQRLGEVPQEQQRNDKVISEAIMSDLKEAKQQVTTTQKGGFAWGIRQKLFGPKTETSDGSPDATQLATDTGVKQKDIGTKE